MHQHPFFVLFLVILSSRCLEFTEGNPKLPTGLIKTIEQAFQHGDDVLLQQVVAHIVRIEETGLARKLHVEEIKAKIRQEMAKLDIMGDGLTKEELNAHMEKYLKNIKKDPWLTIPNKKKDKELATLTAENMGTDLSKPSGLMLLFKRLFGGAVALLVFAAVLKLAN